MVRQASILIMSLLSVFGSCRSTFKILCGKRKRKELILHADPEGYELHAEVVVGPVILVD